ncbi:MAG: hypothetical protein ACI83W_000101 [Marinoscillum sp.]|jgi:hypothetical protein
MRSILKRIALVFFVLLILAQVFPGERPEVIMENPNDIHQEIVIETGVSTLLRAACYDCHSNETSYPWYVNVVPVSWLVIHDINEARGELNFSNWKDYSPKKKHHKLEEIAEEVSEREMPLEVYTITHQDAKLSEAQISLIVKWAQSEMENISLPN